MDNKTRNIIRKIKELLEIKKWNQADLAYHAGITEQTLTNLLKGYCIPKDITLQKIAEALGVYKEYLTGETNYKTFDSWLDLHSVYYFTEKQELSIFNLFSSWGYHIEKTENNFYLVTAPSGSEKILCKWHLESLFYNFFVSFDSVLLPVHLAPNDILNIIQKDNK